MKPANMQSWRLFLFLEDFKNLSSLLKGYEGPSIYLRLSIQEWTTVFEIELKSECNLEAKIIKLVHLLSET